MSTNQRKNHKYERNPEYDNYLWRKIISYAIILATVAGPVTGILSGFFCWGFNCSMLIASVVYFFVWLVIGLITFMIIES